jgi:YNFM family putative membrane transporter
VRLILSILTFAGFIAIAGMRVIDPLLPAIANEFGVSIGAAGIVITAFSVPYGVCLLGYGPLGDRRGKLKVIAVTLGLSALCVAACGSAHSVNQLALGRFATGMTCAATVPLTLALIADQVEFELRQAVLARFMSGIIMGQIVGVGCGGILSDVLGWRAVFWLFGGLSAFAAGLVWWVQRHVHLPATEIVRQSPHAQYWALLNSATARDVLTAVFVEGFFMFAGIAYIGAMLHQRHGLKMSSVGLFLVCLGLGSLSYSLMAKWLIKRLGQRLMMIVGGVMVALAFLVLGFARQVTACAPTLFILGFGLYLMHNTLQTLATELAPDARATSVALFAFLLFAGQGLGAFTLGHAIDRFGYPPTFGFVGVALGMLGMWMQGSRCFPRPRA